MISTLAEAVWEFNKRLGQTVTVRAQHEDGQVEITGTVGGASVISETVTIYVPDEGPVRIPMAAVISLEEK